MKAMRLADSGATAACVEETFHNRNAYPGKAKQRRSPRERGYGIYLKLFETEEKE